MVFAEFISLLTNGHSQVNNEAMSRVLHYILSHTCCMLIALPIGWCCWLPSVRANEDTVKPTCCCCGDQETPTPSKPAPPTPKVPPCCCEPIPVVLSDSSRDESPVQVSFVFLPANFNVWHDAFAVMEHRSLSPDRIDTSPPLQILFCTWLC